jgi:hypothetical protein
MSGAYVPVAAQVRDEAARLVAKHAARLGMDAFAAEALLSAIRAIPIIEPDPDTIAWVWTNGRAPALPGGTFVIVRYEGETRDEAEAHRDGYGEPADSVNWAAVIEYRRKRAVAAA